MRPDSIKKFDYLYLGGLALGILSFILNFDTLAAQVQADAAESGIEMGSGFAAGSFIFGVIISLAIWFLISRLRIEIVKWVLVVFFVIGLIGLPAILADIASLNSILSLVVTVMQGAAIYFLFTPDAKAWFAEKRGD